METKQIKIKEQEEVLNVSNKNLIVSASAGSGKTTVMIRKILKYILEGDCHVDQLLVLTYTKSAALEMKKKLIDKIKENLETNPKLLDELDLVPISDISTFDSFCQKLVKKYFYILEIDPSFSILEGKDQAHLQDKALTKTLKAFKLENTQAYENLLENFSAKRDESTIKSLILEIYNYLTSIYNDQDFICTTQNLYNENLKIAEKVVSQHYKSQFNDHVEMLEKLKLQSNNCQFEAYTKYISEIIITLETLISDNNFGHMVDTIQQTSFPILKAEKTDEIGFKEQIVEQRMAVSKLFDEIKKQYINSENIKNSYQKCQKIMQNLIALLNSFKKEYEDTKFAGNVFDFNDIERFAIKLLENKSINEEIKNAYKHIFVDEFQDANKVQEKIIFLLNNNNLFFVGDTKQSIYAFRQSDPEIFLNIQNKFEQQNESCSKTLNCNFRTNKNILLFVNQIFNVVMTEKTCGLNYFKTAQFDPKAQYLDVENEKCVSVNVLLSNNQEAKKIEPLNVYSVKENSGTWQNDNKFDQESLFICEKITSLIGEQIYDKDMQKTRPITYKDICILILKRGKFLSNLTRHLNSIGIPYIVNVNQNLEECYDNQVLYSFMKLTQNINDDYSLYMVMSSPLFNFTDGELGVIKENNLENDFFVDCVKNYANNDQILLKIKQFFEILDEFSYNIKYKGIFYALDNIVKKTEYLLKISYDQDFSERKTNIIDFVNSFVESKYNNNLCEYLTYRETSLRKEKVQNNKSFNEAVEITTMHSSKGLEYPVVILPFLSTDFSKEAYVSDIKINKELGIGVKHYNSDDRTISGGVFYNACKIKNKQIESSEKIRLLYVATTRAKNKLILSGVLNGPIKKFSSDLQILQCNNYLSLVLSALPQKYIDSVNAGTEDCIDLFNNNKLQLCINKTSEVAILKQEIVMPKQTDEKNVNFLSEYLNKDIGKQKSNIAIKNSVSKLMDENSSINFAPKTFMLKEHLTESVNQTGTIYHSLLEKIDFGSINSLHDITEYIACNFEKEEVDVFKKIGFANIYNNIKIIKQFINPTDIVLKEQKFVMRIPYNQVVKSEKSENILIQGIMDLIVIKPDKILLIDYKLSNKTEEQIIKTYSKQLELYSIALSKMNLNLPIKKYILCLKSEKLINL